MKTPSRLSALKTRLSGAAFGWKNPNVKAFASMPQFRELGVTGDETVTGWLQPREYLADLRPPGAYRVYDEMRRSMAPIDRGLKALSDPLHRATWTMEPGNESSLAHEIAETIQRNLIDGDRMAHSWDYTLRHAIDLRLAYGTMPMEPVWRRDSITGELYLRKLSPRMPETIVQWYIDEHGGLEGIEQININTRWRWPGARTGVGDTERPITPGGNEPTRGRQHGLIWIPVVDGITPKLVVFVNRMESSDFYGVPVLRAAYQHWFILKNLYNIESISYEARAMGFTLGRQKPGGSDNAKGQMETLLQKLHTREKGYGLIPEGWEIDIKGVDGDVIDGQPMIQHHVDMCFAAFSAEYLRLGSDGGGSLALGRAKGSDFVNALHSVGAETAEVFNRHLLPKWVAMVWGPEAVRAGHSPKLTHTPVNTIDTKLLGEAVATMVNSKIIEPGFEDEEWARALLELPDRDDANERRVVEAPPAGGVNGRPAIAGPFGPRNPLPEIPVPAPGFAPDGEIDASRVSGHDGNGLDLSWPPLFSDAQIVEAETNGMTQIVESRITAAQFSSIPDAATDIDLAVDRSIQFAAEAGISVDLANKGRHLFSRPPIGAEFFVDFALIAGALDTAQETAEAALGKVVDDMILDTMVAAEALFEDGNVADLASLTFVEPQRLAEAVGPVLREVYRTGADEVVKELRRMSVAEGEDGPSEASVTFRKRMNAYWVSHTGRWVASFAIDGIDLDDPAEVLAWLSVMATNVQRVVVSRLNPTMLNEILGASTSGALDTTDITAMLAALSTKEIKRAVQNSLAEALGAGRRSVQQDIADIASRSVYSAILDEQTCDPCREMDGTEFETGSREYVRSYPPLKEPTPCDGRHLCRCDMIAVLNTEMMASNVATFMASV